jgi:hypothetical protein
MAQTDTPTASREFPDNTQPAATHAASASGSDAPAPQMPRRHAAETAAFPPHRKHGARQRPSTPQHKQPGGRAKTLQEDTDPAAASAAGRAYNPSTPSDAGGPGQPDAPASTAEETTLALRISASLLRQLKAKAHEEGISPTVLATELLAEGLVLRTWEILERRVAMRGGDSRMSSHAAPAARGARAGGGGHNNQGGRGGRRPPQRPRGNVMDDQATFLEYVRTQERKRR